MTDARRPLRVAEQIRGFLSAELTSHSGDPRLTGLVITRVDVPADMQLAKVAVRLLVGDDDPVQRKRSLAAVQRASGRLRAGLGRLLRAKRVPELRFEYDDGHDTANRVAELLSEIEREPKAAPDEPPDEG